MKILRIKLVWQAFRIGAPGSPWLISMEMDYWISMFVRCRANMVCREVMNCIINNGNGTFTESAEKYGLALISVFNAGCFF